MQFHHNGFHKGDPSIADDKSNRKTGAPLPDEVDVLIIGSGPAGLTLAAQLSHYPEISTVLLERNEGPMERGQADGVSCRSMEMFQAFGFAHKVWHEAYQVNETTFWKPNPDKPSEIIRTGRVQDVEDGLSEMPHLILNQARIHDMYLDVMARSPSRLAPDYGWQIADLAITDNETHPVTVTAEQVTTGVKHIIKARYVVGCDGARSAVRSAIGLELKGDSANKAWGVMDVLAITDFPDIRQKTLIQSQDEGTILIIPREGGYLARLYVEMETLAKGERVRNRNITQDDLIAAATRIFKPYSLEVKDTIWWSVYEIGQRLTDRFDDLQGSAINNGHPHVFIAGDACHTHSPKAGQGMNVSMGDSFNLGWKLISVLQGHARPDLLRSYTEERQQIAQDLIDFDQQWARIIAERKQSEPKDNEKGADDTPQFQKYFIEHGRYTAGVAVRYQPSSLTSDGAHQHLAKGFDIGMRFHSAPVIRLADALPLSLGHIITIDRRWRLFAFADETRARFNNLCQFLSDDAASPLQRHGTSLFDLRAIIQQDFRDVNITDMPAILRPARGRFGLTDYENVFCPDRKNGPDIFDLREIDRKKGCLVIVRPDQYVASILPLDDHAGLSAFFAKIFR